MKNNQPDRLREMRKRIEKSKLSIPAIARKAEINSQTIYNYLAGRSDMKIGTYDKIVAVITCWLKDHGAKKNKKNKKIFS